MELKGKIIVIGSTIQVSESFKKRPFVIKTEDQYPQEIQIELKQDKCSLIDLFKVGDIVTVGINITGRSWTNPQGEIKYFNNIEGWKINGDSQQPQQVPQQVPQENLPPLNVNNDLPW